ncbi:MFS transporter [Antrihabitans cavernicola]|uniref:MFS transporter n=1 Tax=Antrihabitans cavernicola TaxID=2495913 RepID=A0A5A7S6V2_9NOCA|nr:MFS transporter [Spelaeibacter cavernicola]KAA0021606.1 MFS transporter [Spelaeibacter cavernicola]
MVGTLVRPHDPDHPLRTEPRGISRLWRRELNSYPDPARRYFYLGITVLATVVSYYELYVQGTVATKIIADYQITFFQFVMFAAIGNLLGAFASVAAGLADRWGRANLVVGGLVLTALLTAFALPYAPNGLTYLYLFAVLNIVEGVTLVATPALIRDFSPQLGRASAMGFWTLGPVLGSLVAAAVSTNTLDDHPDWRFQFHVAGIVGIVVAVIALLGIRELSPRLRDQLMVSVRDRQVIEARAAGIDPEQALKGSWRQMMKFDIIGSAFAIALFLLFYYIFVGFFVVYYGTVFGYSEARANGLANWYWVSNAITLVICGVLSDKLRVRKPFMLVGAIIAVVGSGIFASLATKPDTSYYTFAIALMIIAIGAGLVFCAWMAGFTETVEKYNPAASATGLAVWGGTLRTVVTIALIVFVLVLPATSTLADHGPRLQRVVAANSENIATAQALSPETLAGLQKDPPDLTAATSALDQIVKAGLAPNQDAAIQRLLKLGSNPIPANDQWYLKTYGADVQQAQKDNPGQWQNWWWACFVGQILFIPFIFIMSGRWSPKKAREDAEAHAAKVRDELAKLEARG